jgi:hypothetical protein
MRVLSGEDCGAPIVEDIETVTHSAKSGHA